MIKTIIYLTKFAIVTAIALLFASCNFRGNFNELKGSGTIVTQTRTVNGDFTKIEASHGLEVSIEQSETKLVTVETDDNLQSHIITRVENGTLYLESDSGYNTDKTPHVSVKLPVITGIKATSGSHVFSNNTLVTNDISVKSDSGSELNVAVEADHITVESSSGSNSTVTGKALKVETSASSGSQLYAGKLMANDVTAQGTSGSHSEVYPIVNLNAKASSGASIDYKKTPKTTLSKDESSGGSVSESH